MIYSGPTAENLACIPDSLKGLKQWVLWRAVWRPYPPVAGDKPTKIPIDPHSLRAADRLIRSPGARRHRAGVSRGARGMGTR